MTGVERHRQMDAVRIRVELTVQDLWLRYLALGGTSDAFDVDGYLQGLVPLDVFQQDVLAQSLNEALRDIVSTHQLALSTPVTTDGADDVLRGILDELLDGGSNPDGGPAGGAS